MAFDKACNICGGLSGLLNICNDCYYEGNTMVSDPNNNETDDTYFLQYVQDVMMKVAIGVQKGKFLPNDINEEAIDLFNNLKVRDRSNRKMLIAELKKRGPKNEDYPTGDEIVDQRLNMTSEMHRIDAQRQINEQWHSLLGELEQEDKL